MDKSLIKLIQPVANGTISQGFGENPQAYIRYGQAGHNGIDYAVTEGTPVMAVADGVVSKVGFDPSGYGNFIQINCGGYSILYGHLSKILVGVGKLVNTYEIIGYSGNTGNSTGPHLHFELRIPEEKCLDYPQGAVDPSPFFVAQEATKPDKPVEVEEKDKPILAEEHCTSEGYKYLQVWASAGANLRLTPGGKKVCAVPNGTKLEIIDQKDKWYGIILWVHGSVVEPVE